MSFSIIIILFFIAVIGIAAIAYFIAEAIVSHIDSKAKPSDIIAAQRDLEAMEKTLAELNEDLLAAKRALTIAKIKRDPNAIIIGYNDKPAKTRRNPHIEFSK